MTSKHDLTPQALEGFSAVDNAKVPYLLSSASWFAWQVGAWLRRTGRSTPRGVRMGRGYHVHANDMLIAFDSHDAPYRVK